LYKKLIFILFVSTCYANWSFLGCFTRCFHGKLNDDNDEVAALCDSGNHRVDAFSKEPEEEEVIQVEDSGVSGQQSTPRRRSSSDWDYVFSGTQKEMSPGTQRASEQFLRNIKVSEK
jgi:hypothetical protein